MSQPDIRQQVPGNAQSASMRTALEAASQKVRVLETVNEIGLCLRVLWLHCGSNHLY